MRERVIFVMIALFAINSMNAEVPAGYYDEAIGKSGSNLQSTLAKIIDHSDPGYDSLWSIYESTDRRDDGKVWDMYSNTSNFSFGSDQCGNYSGEGDCYNREHSIPKSWRGGTKYSDAHIVVPTDGYVNNRRGNYPFGEVGSSSYVSDNSFSKLGTCVTSGYSGTVFEPNDEYKGDFARIYFYAATRYYSQCGSWSGNGFSGSFPHLDEWVRVMMLRWHELDPVSEKEINRNDAVYASKQGNRNPFVDYPELVELIFGNSTSTPFNPGSATQSAVLESPVADEIIDMGAVSLAQENAQVSKNVMIKGRDMSENLTLSLSGNGYFTITPTTLSAAEANEGKNVQVTYAPKVSGNHEAILTIAGGGMSRSVAVTLKGYATEDFMALKATNMTPTQFQANWSRHSQATDYELAVWYNEGGAQQSQTILDVNFADGVPSGWSKTGFTGSENNAVRLASGSNDGVVTTPAIDLSSASTLTVTCSPYKTSDNSVLYILVDGNEVAQVDCAAGAVTQEISLEPATQQSTISFKAAKSHRVYLQSATLTTGGSQEVMSDGYPQRVGNVLSYQVDNLIGGHDYYYKVTAYKGNQKLEESNTILVALATDVESVLNEWPQNVFVYAYNRAIYVDDAPANARINCYTLDGQLCATRTTHATREVMEVNRAGIYIVQLVTEGACHATKLVVY